MPGQPVTGGASRGQSVENGRFGNVGKLVVAPGSYVSVAGDPTTLADESGGVIPQQSLGVLRVLP